MKTLEEIKEIAATYSGGPIVITALKDAIKWAEAAREVCLERQAASMGSPGFERAYAERELDAEIKEKLKNNV